jgi:hypothetical protein
MSCLLCEDLQLHNRFVQEHKTKTPRAPEVATLLGVTAADIVRHRRHEGCFTVKFPIVSPVVSEQGLGGFVMSSDKNPLRSPSDPLSTLQDLQSTLQALLAQIRRGKTVSAGDVVRVTSEIRALILAGEDLAIKLAAAKGSEHSAFTQPEIQEILLTLKDICPACREKVCGKISIS